MSVFDKQPSPDDERYPKWLVQRSYIVVPLTCVALWAVFHLTGLPVNTGLIVFSGVFGMVAVPAMARMRQSSPEAKEAARLEPAVAGWRRIDAFLARGVWMYPTSLVIFWMLLGGFLTVMSLLLAAVGLTDVNLITNGIVALAVAIFFGLGTAAIARGLLLRRRARRHSPPGTEPLLPS